MFSTPDIASISWKLIEVNHANPYWSQFERLHMFDREQLVALLDEAGFKVVHLSASGRELAHIELFAVRS